MLLEARNLHIGYGGAPAVIDASLDVGAGEIIAVIGPNGAGQVDADQRDRRDAALAPGHAHISTGIDLGGVAAASHVPLRHRAGAGGTAAFRHHVGEENLEIGCYRGEARRAARRRRLERVYALFPVLRDKRHQHGRRALRRAAADGGDRPGDDGEAAPTAARRAVARPCAGHRRRRVPRRSAACTRRASRSCSSSRTSPRRSRSPHRAYVLEEGRIVAEGLPADLLAQTRIREAYLGM